MLTGQELVTRALDELADGSPAKLVRVLRLGEVMDTTDPAAQVRRWRDGKHDPNYTVTMRLLEGLGLLREAATEGSTPSERRRVSDARLEELADEVTRQGQATLRSIRALNRAIEHLASRQESTDPLVENRS